MQSYKIPLSLAVLLFEAKIEASLAFGRWLLVDCPGVRVRLDGLFKKWARLLLGADSWRNGAVATSELGWGLGGFCRCVRSVALRRAKLLMLPPSDPYATIFRLASDRGIGWAETSRALLRKWGIPDWNSWAFRSYVEYKSQVDAQLGIGFSEVWASHAAEHCGQVPYTFFQASPSQALRDAWSLRLPWDVQLALRSWCRLRAGLIMLRHIKGERSDARHQRCIFCDGPSRNGTVHVLGVCGAWRTLRDGLLRAMGLVCSPEADEFTQAFFEVGVGSPVFSHVAMFAQDIDRRAESFWTDR